MDGGIDGKTNNIVEFRFFVSIVSPRRYELRKQYVISAVCLSERLYNNYKLVLNDLDLHSLFALSGLHNLFLF